MQPVTAVKPVENMILGTVKEELTPWLKDFIKTIPPYPVDHYSSAKPEVARTTHMKLSITKIDFEKKVLSSTVEYHYQNFKKDNDKLILDVSKIKVNNVFVNGNLLQETSWSIKEIKKYKCDALEIAIPKGAPSGTVQIKYETFPNAKGLVWRVPKKSDDKKHPMLFTHSEAIDGSSFLPGQHSPQIQMTSEVTINTDSPDLMAVVSSINNPDKKSSDGIYQMNTPIAIPLYLLRFAVGAFQV